MKMMNKQEIQKAINHLIMLRRLDSGEKKGLYDLAISALEKTSDKNCSRCIDKGKCVIHDNFNIDYCSDWRYQNEFN